MNRRDLIVRTVGGAALSFAGPLASAAEAEAPPVARLAVYPWPFAPAPGERYCLGCDAALFPAGRIAPGHVAARFAYDDRRHHDVYVGGVTHTRCYEAIPGDPGWLVVGVESPTGGIAVCDRCLSSPAVTVRIAANVEVRRIKTGSV